jgi:FO synthase
MGLMLESISPRLRSKGEAHYHAPDKDPAVRMEMMRTAGELGIPFTTGILLGIGETLQERVESLAAIRALHREYGHIQEVIIQNFRAKPTTKMASSPEPASLDIAKTIAIGRLMLREMNIQAPPNLSPYDHRLFLSAGINDWGGISPLTPDYVNPEAPWPHLRALADTCHAEGFELHPRLPIYAEYVDRPGFLDPALRDAVRRCADEKGVPLC